MTTNPQIIIRPFTPADQIVAKQLILAGMAEYWGEVDETLNPDLNDIATSYAHATFLVAEQNSIIIGTGALLSRANDVGEIVRMSVLGERRNAGIGTQILNALCQAAQPQKMTHIILETNANWQKAVAFYERYGFQQTHFVDGKFGREVYFSLSL